MRNKWLILFISPLLLVSLLLSSCTCNCSPENDDFGGDWNPDQLITFTFDGIFGLPVTLDGTVSMSWNHTGEKFLIVGGQDLFGGNPHHTRFILSGDSSGVETIESIDNPELDGYQRYECVMYNPAEDYALVSGINGSLWKVSGGNVEAIPTGTSEPLWSITWEPHGDYALIGSGDFILKYDGTSIQEFDTGGHGFRDASWSPDGTYVLLADSDAGEIGMYDGESFSTLTIPDYDEYRVQNVSFSPVTEYALIGTQHSMIGGPYQALIGYDGSGFELIEHPIHQFPTDMFWAPDGSFAYIGNSFGRDTAQIYRDGSITSIDMAEYGDALGWSPDGKHMVFCGTESIEFLEITP